jgi:hypothetical protein
MRERRRTPPAEPHRPYSTVRSAASLACIASLLLVGGSLAPSGNSRVTAAGAQSPSPVPAPSLSPSTYRATHASSAKSTSDLLLKLGARPLSESGVQILDLFYK